MLFEGQFNPCNVICESLYLKIYLEYFMSGYQSRLLKHFNSYIYFGRSCAAAAFGTTSLGEDLETELLVLTDTTSASLCDETAFTVSGSESAKKWLWNWQRKKEEGHLGTQVQGKVLLGLRGQCFFEDKARLAEKYGASALLIANTEVRILYAINTTTYYALLPYRTNCSSCQVMITRRMSNLLRIVQNLTKK